MATTPTDIGSLIDRSPGICGGRPRIAGTGVSVARVVGWYKLGWSPEEIADRVGLTLAQAHAALAYYHANQQVMEAELAAEGAEYERCGAPTTLQRWPADAADIETGGHKDRNRCGATWSF